MRPPITHTIFMHVSDSKTILLRSSWQLVNIGDVSHSPGVLALIERFLPETRVILWSNLNDKNAAAMLRKRFPRLSIVYGEITSDGEASTPELTHALDEADFFLHGSGPSIVAQRDLEYWHLHTGKPYGIYGITIDPLGVEGAASLKQQKEMMSRLPEDHLPATSRTLLDHAEFVYCRDSLTLDYLKKQGIKCPVLEFGPDAAFSIDVRDDEAATAFLDKNNLKPGEFICFVPRLRYTPYNEIHQREATDAEKHKNAISAQFREKDMAKVREFITLWVRKTGIKVLLAPEMTYQIDIGKESIYDQLSNDVRQHVIWRPDFWLPDEACSVYALSHSVVSMDNHSPIFALALGIPTLFLRHTTDTTKGEMWYDIGMDEWFMEIDDVSGQDIYDCLISIHQDRPAALAKVAEIMDNVQNVQQGTMNVLRESLSQCHNNIPT